MGGNRYSNMEQRIVSALKHRVVRFRYQKLDGTMRNAVGTLNPRIIGKYRPNVSIREILIADKTNRYFDIECQQWRRVSANAKVELIADLKK